MIQRNKTKQKREIKCIEELKEEKTLSKNDI